MAMIKSRLLALEVKSKNKPIIITPELREDFRIVEEYFEMNGRNLDTMPRDDFSERQREILAILIKFEREF